MGKDASSEQKEPVQSQRPIETSTHSPSKRGLMRGLAGLVGVGALGGLVKVGLDYKASQDVARADLAARAEKKRREQENSAEARHIINKELDLLIKAAHKDYGTDDAAVVLSRVQKGPLPVQNESLERARRSSTLQSLVNHAVSEAEYLNDPDNPRLEYPSGRVIGVILSASPGQSPDVPNMGKYLLAFLNAHRQAEARRTGAPFDEELVYGRGDNSAFIAVIRERGFIEVCADPLGYDSAILYPHLGDIIDLAKKDLNSGEHPAETLGQRNKRLATYVT